MTLEALIRHIRKYTIISDITPDTDLFSELCLDFSTVANIVAETCKDATFSASDFTHVRTVNNLLTLINKHQ